MGAFPSPVAASRQLVREALFIPLQRPVAVFIVALVASRAGFAQNPAGRSPASSEPQLPAEVQSELDKLQAELKAAQSAMDDEGEAKALNALGDLYFQVSDYPTALNAYHNALAQARTTHDAQQQAAALNGLASCYRTQIQSDEATQTYQQALEIATASGDLKGQATALNGLGWVASNQGKL